MEHGTQDFCEDRRALSAILKGVSPEMLWTLAVKDTDKLAWDTIKRLCVGDERVQEARAQTRCREFGDLKFKDGESIEEFAMRLTAIVNDLDLLGDPVTEYKAVLKFLRAVPKRYKPMAMAIRSLCDLKVMTIEELSGRLVAVEDDFEVDDVPLAGGRLLLTEEEWAACQRSHECDRSGGGNGKSKVMAKPKSSGADRPSSSGAGAKKKKGECRYCGITGH